MATLTPAQSPAEIIESARLRGASPDALRIIRRQYQHPDFPNQVRDVRLFHTACEALVPASAKPSAPASAEPNSPTAAEPVAPPRTKPVFLPAKMFENGFTDLVSVSYPGGTISPGSKLVPATLGKCPARKNRNGTLSGYDWRRAEHTVEDVKRWEADGLNVGLRATNFPALDIDSMDETIAAAIEKLALEYLGPAPVRFGRRPKRLLMYQTSEPFGRLRISGVKDGEKHLVEFLGTGQQYLVHGVHPCGVNYEWTCEMREVLADALTPVTKEKALAFRDVLRNWFEAMGYEIVIEGDGKKSSEDAPEQLALRAPSLDAVHEAMSFMPNDNAHFGGRQEWLNVAYALRAAAGPENEHEARQLFVDWSMKWEGNEGHPDGNSEGSAAEEFRRCVPPYKIGWPWLAEQAREFGYSNASDDFEALDPMPADGAREEGIPPIIEKLNEEYALVKELAGVVLHTPHDDKVSLIDTPHWKNHVALPPKTAAHWLRHPKHREYRRLVMNPDHPPRAAVPNGTRLDDFNLWDGLAVQPSDQGSCALFLDHLRTIICDGEPQLYQWVVSWLADIFHSPGRPVGTALALRGVQGAGKDTVGEILRAILGESHHTVVSSPEEVTGTFNAHLEGRIVLQVEEAFFAGDKRMVGKLKSLITSSRLRINQKNVPAYEVANLLRLFITSNEDWVVPAGLGERRFAVLDVSPARAKDRPYFVALRRQMFSEGGCARLLQHLLYEVKVDRDLISQPPATKALLSQQERGFTGMQRWAMECAGYGRLPGGGSEPDTEAVFGAIRLWLRNRHESDRASSTSIGDFLVKYGVRKRRGGSGRRRYQYVFPPLAEFRAALAKGLSITPEWDDVGEWEPEVDLEALP